MLNVSEYLVEFKVGRSIKFMLYHLVFFYLGFVANIFIWMFDSRQLINNMSFWITTKNSPSFYTQIFQWLTNMIVMFMWI